MARKILLADDSVTAQNMGRKILADAGYEVIAVNNGSAALKKIAELKPDLVILDVYMPGYSGLEVCQRLKESQETARIPVLLSVGKLEPFKPEEAQRVRADGFIVKPFEASELLSALSKLEDKVVPRAEPSKPGRFARAIAAAEEAGRGSRNESASDEGGWKNRISFPHQKTEPEEKVADEAAIYNPVNRDLRTVVNKAGPDKKEDKKEDKRQEATEAAETSVDVAALAPAGLPKDVTPEEVAAIAAAAAQMQRVSATLKDVHQVSAATSQASLEPASGRVEDHLPSPPDVPSDSAYSGEAEAKTEPVQEEEKENKIDSLVGETAAADAGRRRIGGERSEEAQDLPVTMAGGPRWTAVSVALEGDEAAISLDQEMQKAYAAFAAAEAVSTGVATAPEAEATVAGNSSAAAVDVPAAIANPEPEPVPETEQTLSAETAEAAAAPVALSAGSSFVPGDFVAGGPAIVPGPANASSEQPEAVVRTPVAAEAAPAEAVAETSPTVEFAKPNQDPEPVAEFVSPVAATKGDDPAGLGAPGAQELQPGPQAEPAMAESAGDASSAFAHGTEHASEHTAEPKPDSEAVKSTAAAWASWRQTRDTSKGSEALNAQSREFEGPESAPTETTAMAVAAGAEQIMQEASAAPTNGDPKDVASIVDSVLADLRPKLMAEISRKMAEKK